MCGAAHGAVTCCMLRTVEEYKYKSDITQMCIDLLICSVFAPPTVSPCVNMFDGEHLLLLHMGPDKCGETTDVKSDVEYERGITLRAVNHLHLHTRGHWG